MCNVSTNKKALVVVAGSFRLCQAIYMTYLFPDYEWDVILISYGQREDINKRLFNICVKSKRFSHIYMSQTPTQYSKTAQLLVECIKMGFYYVIGKRTIYAEKLIEKSIGKLDHELICIACSYSLLEGAILCINRKVKVIIMEEGLDDYVGQKLECGLIRALGAKILFRMQYINLLGRNDYKPYKYSEKYVRYPELIRDNIYLKVNKMFDYSKIDINAYNDTLSDVFDIKEDNYDVIIYTDPLWHYGLEEEYHRFEEYVSSKYRGSKVLLKRHPQDLYHYNFVDMEVEEKYLEVPGEIIMMRWNDAVHIFTYPSTILLGAGLEKYKYELIYFSNASSKTYVKVVNELIEFLKLQKDSIVEL